MADYKEEHRREEERRALLEQKRKLDEAAAGVAAAASGFNSPPGEKLGQGPIVSPLYELLRETTPGRLASAKVAGSLAQGGETGKAAAEKAGDLGLIAKPPEAPPAAPPEGVPQNPERGVNADDETGGDRFDFPSEGGGGRPQIVTGSPYARVIDKGHDMAEAREHMKRADNMHLAASNIERRVADEKAKQERNIIDYEMKRKEIQEEAIAAAEYRRQQKAEAFEKKVEAARADDGGVPAGVGGFFSALGVALGAYASSITGRPNTALQIYQSGLEQEAARRRQRRADEDSEYSRMMNIFGNEKQAELAVKMRIQEQARDHLRKVEASAKGEFARAKAIEFRAKVEEGLAENVAKMRMIEDGQVKESQTPIMIAGKDGRMHEITADRPQGWDGQAPQGVAQKPEDAAPKVVPEGEREDASDPAYRFLGAVGGYMDQAEETKPKPKPSPVAAGRGGAVPSKPLAPIVDAKTMSDPKSAYETSVNAYASASSPEKAVLAKIKESASLGKWVKGRSLIYDQGRNGKYEDFVGEKSENAQLLRELISARNVAQSAEALKRISPDIGDDTIRKWQGYDAKMTEIMKDNYTLPYAKDLAYAAAKMKRDSVISHLSKEGQQAFATLMSAGADFITLKGGKAITEGEKTIISAIRGDAGQGVDGIINGSARYYEASRDTWRARVGSLPLIDLYNLYRHLGPDKVNPPPYRSLARATVAPR
jgi:hypothetical protein